MIIPACDEILSLSGEYDIIPICREIYADVDRQMKQRS